MIFSMKSLTAAGKFKKRRHKEDNLNKRSALTSFLNWFDGSQALERIINIERAKFKGRRKFKEDTTTELVYMIKRVKVVDDVFEIFLIVCRSQQDRRSCQRLWKCLMRLMKLPLLSWSL